MIDLIPFPIEKELLLGILTDAIEGGMAQWAQVERYDWPRWYDDSTPQGNAKPEVEGDYVLLRVRDIVDDKPWVDVTVDLLERSTQWALINHPRWLPFSVSGGVVTDIDYDAVGSDIILQKAVLNDVIYG